MLVLFSVNTLYLTTYPIVLYTYFWYLCYNLVVNRNYSEHMNTLCEHSAEFLVLSLAVHALNTQLQRPK
jgi:hypothetical protein